MIANVSRLARRQQPCRETLLNPQGRLIPVPLIGSGKTQLNLRD